MYVTTGGNEEVTNKIYKIIINLMQELRYFDKEELEGQAIMLYLEAIAHIDEDKTEAILKYVYTNLRKFILQQSNYTVEDIAIENDVPENNSQMAYAVCEDYLEFIKSIPKIEALIIYRYYYEGVKSYKIAQELKTSVKRIDNIISRYSDVMKELLNA